MESNSSPKQQIAITSYEQVEELRQRRLAGEALDLETYRAVLHFLRQAETAKTPPKAKGAGKRTITSDQALAALTDLIG